MQKCKTGESSLRVYCSKEQFASLKPIVMDGVEYTVKTTTFTDEEDNSYDGSISLKYHTEDETTEKTYTIRRYDAEILSESTEKELKGNGYIYHCFSPKETGVYTITIGKGSASYVDDSMEEIMLANVTCFLFPFT